MEESSKPVSSKKKKRIIIGSIVVIIIVIILLFYVLSPSLSPISSIRDTDGDGYVDSEDAFPTIASQWSDLDHDGFGDNPNGITPDKFPNDASEWFDSDDDGVGDNSDVYPYDPLYSADGSATIIVTITADHIIYGIHYKLFLNSALKSEGDLSAGASTVVTLIHAFKIGVSNSTIVTVLATSTGGGWGSESDSSSGLIVNGGTYPVHLYV